MKTAVSVEEMMREIGKATKSVVGEKDAEIAFLKARLEAAEKACKAIINAREAVEDGADRASSLRARAEYMCREVLDTRDAALAEGAG